MSDAGAPLIGAVNRKTKLTESLCSELVHPGSVKRVDHSNIDLFMQRVVSIALQYANGNDAAQVRHDPTMKSVCSLKPSDGDALAPQPTPSRFEYAVTGSDVVAPGRSSKSK